MTVPASGEITMFKIGNEKNQGDYTDDDGEISDDGGISLRGLSSNSHSDTVGGSVGNINLNANSTNKPDQTEPHRMSEFHGYDHNASPPITVLHSTTFQPQMREWIVPYQPVRQGSGFTTSNNLSNNAPNNMGSVTSAGTFTVGGLTGVNLSAMYNYDSNKSSDANNGEKIILQFHSSGSTNFADSGWTTCKIYNGSSNSGTLVVTLTRSSATSFSSTITGGGSGTRALYTFNGTRAFSNHFGTDGTASNNDQHFLEIIE